LLFCTMQILCTEFTRPLLSGAADDAEKQRRVAFGKRLSQAVLRLPGFFFVIIGIAAMTDAEILATMPKGKPGAFSLPLQEPAQFATANAQINYEITQMAMRNARPSGQGSQLKDLAGAEKTITKERVLEEVRRADLRPLWIGRYASLWAGTCADRNEALKELRADMVREHYLSAAARLDGCIAAYFVSWTLGWDDAQSLVFDAIKQLRRLVALNAATGEYQFRRHCEKPARSLWARMVRTRMSAAAVRAEVDKIRPVKGNPKIHGRAGAAVKFLKQLRTWKWESQEQVLQALEILQERLAAMRLTQSTGYPGSRVA
jgi:hypothetical protein